MAWDKIAYNDKAVAFVNEKRKEVGVSDGNSLDGILGNERRQDEKKLFETNGCFRSYDDVVIGG